MKFPLRSSGTKQGSIVLMALVYGSIFLSLIGSLTGFVLVIQKAQFLKQNQAQAFAIAESGLEYYRWYLAHNPNDITDGTGQPGPYVHTFSDPETGAIGKYSLQVSSKKTCGITQSINITSTGWTLDDPGVTQTVSSVYTRPSVANYAYILNSNVWAGSDREIYGPYFSNGGIRMDGLNHSTVSSGVSTWQCTTSFGCSGTQTKNGVFGAGTNQTLWKFPQPSIDFNQITVDLAAMKTAVQAAGGIYLAPIGGYHLVLKSNGSVDIYKVRSTTSIMASPDGTSWVRDPQIIASEQLIRNQTIPAACPIIFAEDNVWLEGVAKGKITVASADVTTPNTDTRIILSNNITYASGSASDGLTAIAEDDVTIPISSPDTMTLSGIFIAQKGHFGRDYFEQTGSNAVPSAYRSYVLQTQLTLNGTIVSNNREGTKWMCGGTYCSGYANRDNTYDLTLANDPPPMTPFVSTDYAFTNWRQKN